MSTRIPGLSETTIRRSSDDFLFLIFARSSRVNLDGDCPLEYDRGLNIIVGSSEPIHMELLFIGVNVIPRNAR